jgi:hypothetical protein
MCNTWTTETLADMCDYCVTEHCNNPNHLERNRVMNTELDSVPPYYPGRPPCHHGNKACNPLCLRSLTNNPYSLIYSCRICYHSCCADCSPPVCIYPTDYVCDDNDWDMIERLQGIHEDPFVCPECYAQPTEDLLNDMAL